MFVIPFNILISVSKSDFTLIVHPCRQVIGVYLKLLAAEAKRVRFDDYYYAIVDLCLC